MRLRAFFWYQDRTGLIEFDEFMHMFNWINSHNATGSPAPSPTAEQVRGE